MEPEGIADSAAGILKERDANQRSVSGSLRVKYRFFLIGKVIFEIFSAQNMMPALLP
jgi:hypothetical protein